jgi:hypothetical protein
MLKAFGLSGEAGNGVGYNCLAINSSFVSYSCMVDLLPGSVAKFENEQCTFLEKVMKNCWDGF